MYKIPKNLTAYSETFLWGMSFKQFGYLAATAFALFMIFVRTQFPMPAKIAIAVPVLLLGLLFIYGRIDDKWASTRNLKKSIRKTGYYDSRIDRFIPVKEVKDDVVFLKSGKLLAVLEAIPIDFDILSEDEQEYVLNAYRNWLRSLDYEVQITCRSVKLEMDEWLNNLAKRDEVKEANGRFNSFRKWIGEFVESKEVRNRVFYIIIPLRATIQSKKSFWQALKSMLVSSPEGLNRDDPAYKKALGELDDRVSNCNESLAVVDVKVRRLGTNELLGLYSSYFTNVPGGGKSYLTPITWAQ